MTPRQLEQLAREWRRFATFRALRWVYVAACLSAVALVWFPGFGWFQVPLVILLALSIGGWRRAQTHRFTAAEVARHLDRTHPDLEESSRLWLHPAGELTLTERWQLARLNRAAARLTHAMPSHRRLGQPPPYRGSIVRWVAAGSALVLAIGFAGAFRRVDAPAPAQAPTTTAAVIVPPAAVAPPQITGVNLTITPPAYTGHAPWQAASWNAEIEEDAAVSWTIALDRPVREAHLVFGPAPTEILALQPTVDQRLQAGRRFSETVLYTLAATLLDGTAWTPPEIHSLKVVEDQPPTIQIVQPAAPRTVIVPSPPPPSSDSAPVGAMPSAASCFVEVQAADDYGLADAHLVATVAKGSGEAVKFREQALPFDGDDEDQPAVGTPRARRFTRTLDLAALGLAPGDELYFYVEARDNRPSRANRTRSETRFLVLQGTDKPGSTAGRGVAGVNLVPQYFRSERQLIIDTEKLLADRPALAAAEFRSHANDLGADQALLRLRYGQFLGEDQETDPLTDHTEVNLDPLQGSVPEHAPGPRAAASVAQRFRQEHAAQAREGGGDESRDASLHPAPTGPLAAEQVRQTFVDSHDTHDKATYFDPRSKATMRDALAAMWEAEGALRVAEPQEALAPEHRALDILKDLQQSDRAYVQHVGFDAPPLQVDERRLKGDATGVLARIDAPVFGAPPDAARADVRAALSALSEAGTVRVETLRRVEPVLTAATTRRPDDFLPGLQALRRLLAAGDVANDDDARALVRALLRLLPPAGSSPVRVSEGDPALAGPYFRALRTGEGKP